MTVERTQAQIHDDAPHFPEYWVCHPTSHYVYDFRLTLTNGPLEFKGDAVARTYAKLLGTAPKLYRAVMHVLEASEDGGDMNDIDWNMLRNAIAEAEG